MTAGIKANADGSAAIQVGGSDAITITSGLNTTFAGTASVATGALYPLVSGTAVTASGTSVDFTGIPSTEKRITVMLAGISSNSTSPIQVQLGTSSGVETTGYLTSIWQANTNNANITTGFATSVSPSLAAAVLSGHLVFTLVGSNIWVGSGVIGRTDNTDSRITGGNKTLAGTLDRVRITTVNGTDTFDAGTINIMWE
jgi:hypothetical protein